MKDILGSERIVKLGGRGLKEVIGSFRQSAVNPKLKSDKEIESQNHPNARNEMC